MPSLISPCMIFVKIALVMCARIITASSSACLQGTGRDAPGFYGHLVVTLDVIFSRGRSKKSEQRQFIKVLRFFCVNLFPGSRVWQCCCSRLGHLALRHYKPICLGFMIFAQYFHFVYFFLARNYWVQWQVKRWSTGSRCVVLGGWSTSSHLHSIVHANLYIRAA